MPRRPTRYYPDFGPQLPTSGPDWRWSRAVELVTSGQHTSLSRDGPDIARAITFIRKLASHRENNSMNQLLRDDPSLTLAVKLHHEDSRRALEIKCRVLGRQSAGVIAVEMGLTESLVDAYCRMFFDVKGRLGATSYILHQVIGLHSGQPPTAEKLMMSFAYNRGPLLIESWLDFLDHEGEDHDLTTETGRMRETIDLLVVAQSLPADLKTSVSLMKHSKMIIESRGNMFRKRSFEPGFSGTVAEMLQETAWTPHSTRGDLSSSQAACLNPMHESTPGRQIA